MSVCFCVLTQCRNITSVMWEFFVGSHRYQSRPASKKGKGSPYSITERRVSELIPVLGSQPAGDVSHKPSGRLPLPPGPQLPSQPLRGLLPILLLGEQRHDGCEQFERTDTRQRRGCDLNPGPSAPESSTLTTRLPSHPASGQTLSLTLMTVCEDIKDRRYVFSTTHCADYSVQCASFLRLR